MAVARLEGNKDISEILEKLKELKYEVVCSSKMVGYVFRKDTSNSSLSRDMKSVKSACGFTGSIRATYGTNSASY